MKEKEFSIDRHELPFFMMDKRCIDSHLSVTAIAVYAFIARHQHCTTTEIAAWLDIPHNAARIALLQLEEAGIVAHKD